jgi:hypothetical protein
VIVSLASAIAIATELGESSAAAWTSAGLSFLAIVAAIALGLGARERVSRPRLRIHYFPEDHVLTHEDEGPRAFVRLRVENTGKSSANNVRVTVIGIDCWVNDQWVSRHPEIEGAVLAWANRTGELSLEIPRNSKRPLDLFKIRRDWEAQGQMPITLMTTALAQIPLPQDLDPGSWRVKLESTADNASPHTGYVTFRFDGAWPAGPPESIWRAVAVERTLGRPQDQPPTPEFRDPEEMLVEAGQIDDED